MRVFRERPIKPSKLTWRTYFYFEKNHAHRLFSRRPKIDEGGTPHPWQWTTHEEVGATNHPCSLILSVLAFTDTERAALKKAPTRNRTRCKDTFNTHLEHTHVEIPHAPPRKKKSSRARDIQAERAGAAGKNTRRRTCFHDSDTVRPSRAVLSRSVAGANKTNVFGPLLRRVFSLFFWL